MKVWGKIISVLIITFLGILACCTNAAWAGPDQFLGDTEIYTGASTHIMPNVLLVVDNSRTTLNTASGAVYDPTHDYSKDGCASAPGGCYNTLSVYQASQQGTYSKSLVDNPTGTLNTSTTQGSLPNIKCTNNNNIITNTLLSAGTYAGSANNLYPNLTAKGACSTTGQAASYALGNFLNYTLTPVPPVLVIGADGNDYKLIVSNVSTLSDQPPVGVNWQTYWVSNGTTGKATTPWTVNTAYDLGTSTQQKIIYDAIRTVVNGARYAVRFGAMVYGNNNHGGHLAFPLSDLTSDADFTSFLSFLPGGTPGTATLNSQSVRPLAETLYDSWDYFQGLMLHFSGEAATPSPVQHYCDRNYIIMITNGLPNAEQGSLLFSLVGDYDNDGVETSTPSSYYYSGGTHFLDDVADMLYEKGFSFTDSNTGTIELMRIKTSTVLAFQADDPLIARAGDSSHGRGGYFHANNANQLAADLNKILANIVLEADTSFVAPVVPVSPENRVYSGNRVYMGFFRPQSGQYWNGNLKKYALDALNNIVDVNGQFATYVDTNGDGKDDRDGSILPQGTANGSFRASAQSFWSTTEDGGSVTKGGAGGVLQNRDFTTNCSNCALTGTVRNIYTYLGTNTDLTDSSNAFTVANTAITASKLGLPSSIITSATTADVGNVINFISGIDAYDDDGNGNAAEKRQWIFGDILHSKPLVINYQPYAQTPTDESDPAKNKTMIFVGSNDGVLHAINDYDGSEAWAFVPPDLLPNLQYLHGSVHSYFVDCTVTAYIYDANQNGTIDPGDKVILILGERRGGGVDTAPTSGVYYALDVTDRHHPVFLWSISNKTVWNGTTKSSSTLYAKLGETWSEPKLGKIKIGTNDKIVAFIGGGYDNCNEDGRYGATQLFTGVCVGNFFTTDSGLVTSPTSSTGLPLQSTGTGIYVVEVATLDSTGAPAFNTSGQQIWAYTGTSYSILSEIAALDTNFDGYIDRLYAGDTGGRLWRFNIMDTSPTNWTATMIFRSNPGYTNGTADGTTGRKIFYKPSAVIEWGNVRLYFGTGDREHPLNTAVVDRLYSVVDNGQTSAVNESKLVDVTDDLLQAGTSAQSTSTLTALNSSSSHGFYIRLNQNTGEKVLAPATVFSKVGYFTTYAPNTAPVADVCQVGNLGTSRIYAVDYKTGAAVINYDPLNDALYSNYVSNSYATPIQGQVLLRSDRVQKLGIGIPSGIVLVLSQSGDPIALVGCGGGICPAHPKPGGVVIPLYWREK